MVEGGAQTAWSCGRRAALDCLSCWSVGWGVPVIFESALERVRRLLCGRLACRTLSDRMPVWMLSV